MLLGQAAKAERELHHRRLSDKIQLAFNHACDDADVTTASELLAALQLVLLKTPQTHEQRDNALGTLYACKARVIFMGVGRARSA
jgi:hypothetical protein